MIVNPAARRASRRGIEKALDILRREGYSPELLYTEKPGDGIRLSKEIIKDHDPQEIHAVIAAGGDGTFNEVANGLVGSPVPMAILPMGTTNVLAKELNIPEYIEGAINLIKENPVSIFPAKVRLISPTSEQERYFLLMAGIGFDGEAVYGVNKKIKRLSGKLAYIMSGAKNFIKYDPVPMKIILDGEKTEGYNAVICKGACYGGYFRMAPDADLKEPFLYAVVFTQSKKLSLLKYVAGVLIARHVRFHDVIYKRVSRIITEPERHVQIDGDYLGKGRVDIKVGQDRLKIFIPNNSF